MKKKKPEETVRATVSNSIISSGERRYSVRLLSELALFTAISLLLYIIESFLPAPFPIPGVKLGLSNIAVLVVLHHYGTKPAFLVLISRILLSCFFFSSFISLAYSLTGGLLCLLTEALLLKLLQKHYLYLISIFGALAHNAGQLLIALLLTKVPGVLVYLPFLIISGTITGLFTGLCAHLTLKVLPKAHARYGSGQDA